MPVGIRRPRIKEKPYEVWRTAIRIHVREPEINRIIYGYYAV